MKGLVMEGGAMRGMFTAGVTDVLMEKNITFDGAVGVSAGACFGCNYKSKQPGRSVRYNLTYCDDPEYVSFKSLIKTGELFNEEFAYDRIPNKLDIFDYETYKNNPMAFYVVCTDLNTGKAVYKRIDDMVGDDYRWLKASASMPLASKIVSVSNRLLLDGGVSDSIPLRFFIHKGYNKNVVILTQAPDYEKKKNKLYPIIKKAYKDYPEFVKAVKERHINYNRTLRYIKQMEKLGRCIVLQPEEKLPIGRICHEPDIILKTYLIGREVANRNIDKIRDYLG